ncbi:hypothetical protein OROHE_026903 [Orobanche hederae]
MGSSLFLWFLIERMHHYMRKLIKVRSKAGFFKQEIERLEKEKSELKEKEDKAAAEKDKQLKAALYEVDSLRKQTENLLIEYDRQLQDNQNLQAKFKIDR